MKAILLALAILGGAETPAVQQRYRIEVTVSELDPTAERSRQTVKRLAEPKVVTLAGRPAYFRAGSLGDGPTGITGPGVGQLRSGVEVRVLPLRLADGRVRVEVSGEWVGGDRPVRFVADFSGSEKRRLRAETGDPGRVMWVDVTVAPVEPGGEK